MWRMLIDKDDIRINMIIVHGATFYVDGYWNDSYPIPYR